MREFLNLSSARSSCSFDNSSAILCFLTTSCFKAKSTNLDSLDARKFSACSSRLTFKAIKSIEARSRLSLSLRPSLF